MQMINHYIEDGKQQIWQKQKKKFVIVWRSQRQSKAQEMEATKDSWSDENISSKGKSNVEYGEDRKERGAVRRVHLSLCIGLMQINDCFS